MTDEPRRRAGLGVVIGLVLVHVLTAPMGLGPHSPWLAVLFAPRSLHHRVLVGSQYLPLIADEPWRLCTTVVLHADALHLGMNVAAVWVLARLLEHRVGGIRFVAWLAIAGFGGAVASYAAGVRLTDGVSGGAFGLLGGAMVVGWRTRDTLLPDERTLFGPVLGGFVAVNLVLSVLLPMVNLSAHVGGLLTGVAWATLPDRPVVRAIEAVALGAFGAACAWGFGTLALR